MIHPDWSPFRVAYGKRGDPPRAINSPEGIGDRLRAAAFAELQAREAFNWAATRFTSCSDSIRNAWRGLAMAEERHLNWLIRRMDELNVSVSERAVSDQLWISFSSCKTAKDFAFYMASAEERGRRAGERFYQAMRERDPLTAEIFRKIAVEEVEHIALARRYFGFPGESGSVDCTSQKSVELST